MAFTLTQSNKGAAIAASIGVSYPGSVAAGHLLIAVVGGGATFPSAVPTISDTLGNSWTLGFHAGSFDDNSEVWLWWTVANGSGSDTVTVDYGGVSGSSCLAIEEWSGNKTSGQPDQINFNNESRATGSITTTASPELTIAAVGGHYTGTWTVNNGFTIDVQLANSGDPSNDGGIAVASLNPTQPTGSYNATFGGYVGSTAGAGIISFFTSPITLPPGNVITTVLPALWGGLAPVIACDLHGMVVVYNEQIAQGSPSVNYPVITLAFTNDLANLLTWTFLVLWDWSADTGPPPPDLSAASGIGGLWLCWDFVDICCGRGYLSVSAKANLGSPATPSAFQELYVGILQWNSILVP